MLTKIEEIAPILTAEQGKTILESRIEAQRFGENIAWFADLADKIHGEQVAWAASPGVALGYLFAAVVCLAFSVGSTPAPAQMPDEASPAPATMPEPPAPAQVAAEPAR